MLQDEAEVLRTLYVAPANQSTRSAQQQLHLWREGRKELQRLRTTLVAARGGPGCRKCGEGDHR